jgi:hypothetical protein
VKSSVANQGFLRVREPLSITSKKGLTMDARSRWASSAKDIVFGKDDFEVLDLAVSLNPDLRISALAVKRARDAKLKYPIERVDALQLLLHKGVFKGGGHHILPDDVHHYMPEQFFPIDSEEELISRIYIALTRCRHEAAIAAGVSPEAMTKLEVVPQIPGDGS